MGQMEKTSALLACMFATNFGGGGGGYTLVEVLLMILCTHIKGPMVVLCMHKHQGVHTMNNRGILWYLDGVLADSESVPEFDGVVSRPRHNLSIVSRERHTHHVLGVTHKPPCGRPTAVMERR